MCDFDDIKIAHGAQDKAAQPGISSSTRQYQLDHAKLDHFPYDITKRITGRQYHKADVWCIAFARGKMNQRQWNRQRLLLLSKTSYVGWRRAAFEAFSRRRVGRDHGGRTGASFVLVASI
eukprot:TRINITY_DN2620_c0_g1_i4.p1 TRINITY_DN2620_c0_g1~~TRINITY_DN2620_c0_g1_i4.p1  ORF type:complete len:120 (+),score=3.67 TRINITY_DN2620_c0_g1_i4:417-776(+)